MDGVTVTLLKNSTKVIEISSNSKTIDAIRDVKERTNKALTEIIEKSSNGDMETGNADNGGEESEEDEDGDPLNKKIKLS